MSISPTYARWVKDISLNKIIFCEMLNSHLMCTDSLHHWSSFEKWHKLLQLAADVLCDALSNKCVAPKKN